MISWRLLAVQAFAPFLGALSMSVTEPQSTERPVFSFFLPSRKWLGHSLFYIRLQFYHMEKYHLSPLSLPLPALLRSRPSPLLPLHWRN